MENKNKKIFIISIIIFLCLFIYWVIYSLIPRSTLTFETAPHQINLLIDDKKYSIENNKSININPGKHKITASRDGFKNYTKSINIENHKTENIIIALTPITDSAKKLLDNTESQNVIFHFGEQIYSKQTDQMTKSYPIVKILPVYARLYTVYTCKSQINPNDATKIAICVDLIKQTTDLKPYILKDIKSRGYDLEKYEIIWKETSN